MKKGFTLIELLAVIVILAIIALIATPIVLGIINDAKKSATIRSAEFYIDALENAIMLQKMKDGGVFSPSVCEINETDNKMYCDEVELTIKIEGEGPSGGSITFEEGKITNVNLIYPNGIVTLNNKGELVLGEQEAEEESKVSLVNHIKNLYSETKTATVNGIEYSLDETHSLMNDRLGNKDVDKLDGNIRYYGVNPNNYIDIGDRDSNGNIIFWRIIGVFKDIEVTDENGNVIKTEDLVKIIRADKLASGDINGFPWDNTSAGASDNNWKDSTLQAMLNDELNGYYASGTPTYYNSSTIATTLNFASTGLSSAAHSKIARVNWNLGIHSISGIYTDTMYTHERAGTNKWSGKISLMNASDYGYSADLRSCQQTLSAYNNLTCTSTNWMYDSTNYQWTLIPNSSNASSVVYVAPSGFVSGASSAESPLGVRPVLYLNSDVGIVEEKETSEGIKYFVVE